MRVISRVSSAALAFLAAAVLSLGCACNATNVQDLERDLKGCREDEGAYKRIVENRNEKIGSLTKTVSELNDEIARLKQELQTKTDENARLTKQNAQLEEDKRLCGCE